MSTNKNINEWLKHQNEQLNFEFKEEYWNEALAIVVKAERVKRVKIAAGILLSLLAGLLAFGLLTNSTTKARTLKTYDSKTKYTQIYEKLETKAVLVKEKITSNFAEISLRKDPKKDKNNSIQGNLNAHEKKQTNHKLNNQNNFNDIAGNRNANKNERRNSTIKDTGNEDRANFNPNAFNEHNLISHSNIKSTTDKNNRFIKRFIKKF